MRILLIGSYSTKPDEGMKRLSHDLRTWLGSRHEVLALDTRTARSPGGLRAARAFGPELIHYVTGPTIFSLIALRLLKFVAPGSPLTVSSGVKPFLGPIGRALLPYVRPDVYLAQSRLWARCFAEAGSLVEDLPNWFDEQRFAPVAIDEKTQLRSRLRLPMSARVVLHVGHVKSNRNLECLIRVQESDRYHVVVIGSESLSERGDTFRALQDAGITVRIGYVPAIEEFYQAADAYVFTALPLPPGRFPRSRHSVGVIDFPLSILEALACGTPVVATPHDALVHFLGDCGSVVYFDGNGDSCLRALDRLLKLPPTAPDLAAPELSMATVLERLERTYRSRVEATP